MISLMWILKLKKQTKTPMHRYRKRIGCFQRWAKWGKLVKRYKLPVQKRKKKKED